MEKTAAGLRCRRLLATQKYFPSAVMRRGILPRAILTRPERAAYYLPLRCIHRIPAIYSWSHPPRDDKPDRYRHLSTHPKTADRRNGSRKWAYSAPRLVAPAGPECRRRTPPRYFA